ncbi:Bug family tripartite tricarboxylate transporter substrate binding protein [Bradyrhizobium liaoningense]
MSKKLDCDMPSNVTRRGFVRLLAAASVFAPSRGFSQEQNFPSRGIRIINPFAPGGNTDIVARLLATHLSNAWGQPVVVENRPGAGATLGTDFVAKSAPDGYTLLIATLAATAIAPSVYRKLPYDPQKNLTSISGLTIGYSAIGITPDLPIYSLKELIEYARARPEKMFYSSPGIGVSSHLAMENFARTTDLKLTHVPYRGSAQALTAVMTGEVQMIFDPISTLATFAQNGNIRALAVSGLARSPLLPDVPTLAELGYPNVKSSAWTGLMAPSGTPASIIQKIRSAVEKLLETDDFKARAAAMANEVLDLSPDRFAEFVGEETRAWGAIAQRVGVSLD